MNPRARDDGLGLSIYIAPIVRNADKISAAAWVYWVLDAGGGLRGLNWIKLEILNLACLMRILMVGSFEGEFMGEVRLRMVGVY